MRFEGLENKNDSEIWQYAKKSNFIIITQDLDFNDMSIINGFPPYVVWIKSGNSTVVDLENILRTHSVKIRDFFENQSLGLIEIE